MRLFKLDDSPYARASVPDEEITLLQAYLDDRKPLWIPARVREAYADAKGPFLPDPFDPDLLTPIMEALSGRRPLSAIRIGDGETNFAVFEQFPETPNLNRHALAASIARRADSFSVDEAWMHELSHRMNRAIDNADIVGVLGTYRIGGARHPDTLGLLMLFWNKLQGLVGHVRGVELMMRKAREGALDDKIISDAHFYCAVLAGLDPLLASATSVYCLTNQVESLAALKRKYPDRNIRHIPVGQTSDHRWGERPEPTFLDDVESRLPDDMAGCLALVGAGVWAEFYCDAIKERGGVAVDIGSGFDLLSGGRSRLFHKALPPDFLDAIMLQG